MNNTPRDLAVYVLVRTDIDSLNPGKAMAQVHHAGVQMMYDHAKNPLVKEYLAAGAKGGAHGFNTTIVLGATMWDILESMARQSDLALGKSCLSSLVVDPSYPFIVSKEAYSWYADKTKTAPDKIDLDDGQVLVTRRETTCAWFLGDRNDPRFKSIFEGLKLHD